MNMTVEQAEEIAKLRAINEMGKAEEKRIRDHQLTKREQFAMAAMQGFLGSDASLKSLDRLARKQERAVTTIAAESAVSYADALIKELEK